MVIQPPSFPSGFPPPRGIEDSPRIMHDKRGCDIRAYRGALTNFNRRALPAEIPAWGEEFGARKLKPVSTRLYGVSTRLYGVARHSKSAPRLSSGGFAACESLAERRVIPSSKNVVRVRTRSERAPVVSKTTLNSHSLIRSPSGSPKSTAGAAEDTFGGKSAHLVNEAVIFLSRALCGEPRGRAIKRRNVLECSAVRGTRVPRSFRWAPFW